MSNVIDNKVVSMEFNNENFEKNVKTSMSTLDRLKEALNFKNAQKSFSNLSAASGRVNLNGLTSAVDNVKDRFSVMEIAGITAIANLTNSAINQGKRMVKALSVDQIAAGWSKFESITGSTQTIMSATGKTIEEVDKQLDKLNWFTDETSYNLTDMTDNIGKFTSAGVDLDSAVTAMQGIATEAALSGANAQQASRAMYNFSQAMGMGSVKLQDWMSIENANMATKEFKETIIETAKELGYLDKNYRITQKALKNQGGNYSGSDSVNYENFRSTLAGGWLDSEVLTNALGKYGKFADELKKAMDMTELDMTSDMLRYIDQYAKGTLDIKSAAAEAGVSTSQLDSILKKLSSSEFELGRKAFKAAQEAKTFTDAMNATKDAVSTSFMNTFKILFGNYEEAKVMWTNFANDLWEIFAGPIQESNEILAGAFDSPWKELSGRIESAAGSTKGFLSIVEQVAKTHKIDVKGLASEYGSLEKAISAGAVPAKVIKEAFDKFTSSAKEATGSTKATTDQLKKFQEIVSKVIRGDFGNGESRIKALTKAGWDYKEVQELVNKQLKNGKITLNDLSDSQLKSVGYTSDQIKAIRELGDEAASADSDISKLISSIDRPSGRKLFTDALANSLHLLMNVIELVKKAWRDIFPKATSERVYDLVKAFHDLTENALRGLEVRADKVTRSLKGVFAILDIIGYVLKSVLSPALRLAGQLFGWGGDKVLDFTANMGDGIVAFDEWLHKTDPLGKRLNKLTDNIIRLKDRMSEAIEKFRNFKIIKNATDSLVRFKDAIITTDRDGVTKVINWSVIFDKCRNVIDKIKVKFEELVTYLKSTKLGSEVIEHVTKAIDNLSDSTKDYVRNIFGDFIDLFNDLKLNDNGLQGIIDSLKEFNKKLVADVFGLGDKLNDGEYTFVDFKNAVKENLNDAGNAADTFSGKVINAARKIREAFQGNVALEDVIAIGLGVGMLKSIKDISVTLSSLDKKIRPLQSVTNMFDSITGFFNNAKLYMQSQRVADTILKVAISINLLAIAMLLLCGIPKDKLAGVTVVMVILLAAVGGLIVALTKLSDVTANAPKIATTLLALAGSLLIIAAAIAILAKLPTDNVSGALAALAGTFAMLLVALVILSVIDKKIGGLAKVGAEMIAMSASLLVLAIAIKMLSKIKYDNIKSNLDVLATIVLGYAVLAIAARKLSPGVGATMMGLAASLAILAIALKLISKLDYSSLRKNMESLVIVFALFGAVMVASKVAGRNANKAGGSILLMSLSLMVIVGAMKMLAKMSPEDIKKSMKVVKQMFRLFSLVIAASKLAGENAIKAGVAIMAMSASLIIIAGVMLILSRIKDTDALYRTAGVITLIILALSAAMAATKGAGDAYKSVVAMVTVIGILMVALFLLSTLANPDAVLKSAIGISLILLALSASFKILQKTGKLSKGVIQNLLIMSLVMSLIGVVLVGLSKLNPQGVVPMALSMGAALLAVAASIKILQKTKGLSKSVLKSVAIMAAIMAGLGLVLGVISLMKPEHTLEIVLSISLMLGVLVGVLYLLQGVGPVSTAALSALAALSIVVAIIGVIIAAVSVVAGDKALSSAIGISAVLMALSVTLLICAAVGTLAEAALIGVASLIVLTAALTAGFVALGALFKKFPKLQKDIEIAIPILEMIADCIGTVIGKVIGNIVKEVMKGVGDGLVQLGLKLSAFMIALQPFLHEAKKIDPESLKGVKSLIEAILLITAAELLEGIASFITGGTDMDEFGDNLVALGEAMADYSEAVAGNIDADAVQASANAAKALAELEKGLRGHGGKLQEILGDADLETFSETLVPFGEAMVEYSSVVAGKIDADAVQASATAAKALVELENNLKGHNGVFQDLFGDADLATFGTKLESFGKSMVTFSETVKGKIDSEAATAAANAGSILADLDDNLSNHGGKLQKWFGDQDIGQFGTNLKKFGEGMGSFADKVKDIKPEAVTAAANAGKMLADLDSKLPKEGNAVWNWFTGAQSLDDFGSKLETFGEGIADFCEAVTEGGINEATVNNAKTITVSLIDMLRNYKEGSSIYDAARGFGVNLKDIASSVKGFWDVIGPIQLEKTKMDNAIHAAESLIPLYKLVADASSTKIDLRVSTDATTIGNMIANFSTSVSKADIDIAAIANATNAGGMIANFMATLPVDKIPSVEPFCAGLSALGPSLVDFSSKIISIDATTVQNNLTALNNALASVDSITTFNESMKTLAQNGVDAFVAYFNTTGYTAACNSVQTFVDKIVSIVTNAGTAYTTAWDTNMTSGVTKIDSYQSKYNTCGKNIVTKFMEKINKLDVKKAFKTPLSSAVSYIRGQYKSFYNAGAYCVSGFCSGISKNVSRATAAGRSLGNAAYNAARRALDEHSPSKKLYQVGEYAVLGFVNAFSDNENLSAIAGQTLGENAMTSLSKAVSMANDIVENGVDSDPIITPVLDASLITSQVGQMNDLFNQNATYKVNGMALSSRMNARTVELNGRVNENTLDKKTFNETIGRLGSEVSELKEVVSNLRIVLDSGATVGGLLPEIDRQLGGRVNKKSRYI